MPAVRSVVQLPSGECQTLTTRRSTAEAGIFAPPGPARSEGVTSAEGMSRNGKSMNAEASYSPGVARASTLAMPRPSCGRLYGSRLTELNG